jgi:GH25 family lysozyme M1 (1,4-beta-N-acetylmuramidase)
MGRAVLIEDLESRTLLSRTMVPHLGPAFVSNALSPATAARATGIDIASYQGAPTWSSVYSSGVQFMYAKATQSTNYIDPDFSGDMTGATAASVVAGAYDFADFTVDPTAEANHFLATASPYVGPGYLRPMLDVEAATSDTASQVSSWVNTWCNDIYVDTGVKPIIYTYISFASTYLQSSVTQWPLWMASPNGQNPQTGNPNATAPWSSWSFWQYGGGAIGGISGTVDEDVANGNMTGYVIPQFVAGSTHFSTGQVVHVNATSGLKAWSAYTSNSSSDTYVVEPNNTNAIIEGNPVYIAGDLRWPVEYAGSSTITWSAQSYLVAGGVPSVTDFSASPNPVVTGNPVTLTATVSDPDSTVSKVLFYRESNGTSGLQTGSGGDTLVGTATSGTSGNWSVQASTTGLTGTVTFYAVATDASGITSTTATTTDVVTTGQIQNTGFETPSVGSGSSGDYAFNPAGAAWTFTGLSGISGNGSAFTAGNPNAPQGTQVAFLENANSAITQTFTFSAGTYQLGFSAAQRANIQASQEDFEVLVDGTVVSQFTPTSTSYAPYSTGPFTVTAGSHTVQFLGLDTATGNNTAFIDNVSVNAAVALPAYITASAGAAYSYNASTGALNLTSGTLTFTADAGTNPLVNLSASGPASKVIFNTSEHIAGLSLSSGATATVLSLGAARTASNHNVLVIGTLGAANDPTFSVDASSKLDLTDNDLIVHSGTSDSTGNAEYTNVNAMAVEGRNPASGKPGSPDGQWNGNGLDSSAANSADTGAGYEKIALGVVLNSTLFVGPFSSWQVGSFNETLAASDIIVKYTYLGDYGLFGKVYDSDAAILQRDFDNGKTNTHTWATASSMDDGLSDASEAGVFQFQYGLGTGGREGLQL